MRLIDEELRAALRAEAAVHRPDREAMLDRITQTAMRNHRAKARQSPRLRITGAAVAVAAVLGGGGFAQWAVAGDGEPEPAPMPTAVVTVAPVPSVPRSPSATGPTITPYSPPSKSPRSSPPGRSASPSSPSSPSSSSSPSSPSAAPATPVDPAVRGALWSDGSVAPDGDSQASSVVTVRTSERLTALEVTIRIARTTGLTARGGSQQVPGGSVTSTVVEEPETVLYRFVLSSGDTLEPGTYTFYARYNHAPGGRDAGADSYAATAATEAGATPAISGDFR